MGGVRGERIDKRLSGRRHWRNTTLSHLLPRSPHRGDSGPAARSPRDRFSGALRKGRPRVRLAPALGGGATSSVTTNAHPHHGTKKAFAAAPLQARRRRLLCAREISWR